MVVTFKCFCVWLCLLTVARCGGFEELEREKRALSTVCVEVKPSVNDKNQDSYFMCKGRSLNRNRGVSEDFGHPERHSLSFHDEPGMNVGYFPGEFFICLLFVVFRILFF